MNNIVLLGRLTRDPEIRYVGDLQTPVANFTIAVDRQYKNKNGEKETDFIPVEIWDRKAEICAQYLTKGRLVSIEGSLRVDKYQTEIGESKNRFKVRANAFNFVNIGKKQDESKSENNYYEGKELFEENCISVDLSEDEIPF